MTKINSWFREDGQSVKASETVSKQTRGWDHPKRINGRKRHLVVDSRGLQVMVMVTPADHSDRDIAREVRRGLAQRWRPLTRLHERQTSTAKHRRHPRDQGEHLAQAAGKLALDTRAEDLAPISQQTGWKPGPIAGYTAAALLLLAQARAVLAAAVAADRAAGATWDDIAAVLEISADTASRRYRA